MSKRKLKGINAKRIPKNKREKMKKTLQHMNENREKDNIILRDLLKAKLNFATEERKKGLETLKLYKEKIIYIEKQIWKLEGAIITINGVFNNSTKKVEKNDTN